MYGKLLDRNRKLVEGAKNFGRFEAFFLPTAQWEQVRDAFWARTGFPVDPDAAVEQLTKKSRTPLTDGLDPSPQQTGGGVSPVRSSHQDKIPPSRNPSASIS